MKARRIGLVVEWVVEEDARRILLSSPPGRLGRSLPLLSLPVRDASTRRRPRRRRSDGTRPGAWEGAFPSSRSQSGMRAGDDDRRDDGATARGRALGTESSPPLAPSQGCDQETTLERQHEAGRLGWSFSPPSSSQSGMRAGDDDGGTMRVRAGRTIGAF